MELGHNRMSLHGKGSKYTRSDAERLFRHLVIEGILDEDLQVTVQEHTACYVKLGSRAQDVKRGNAKVSIPLV